MKTLARVVLGTGLLVATLWGGSVIALAGPEHATGRQVWVAVHVLAGLAAAWAIFSRHRRTVLAFPGLASIAAVAIWWAGLQPSNDRDWQADVAVLPSASVEGNRVTIRGIRNFDYRTETDYTPGYYDRQFDLDKLEGVDVIASYWMGPDIAHIFVSFRFAGSEPLAVSIETRKERHETYSTVKGFFRQYELYYVVADERDVVRLRTDVRKDPPEEVFIYPLKATPEAARRLFLDYLREINELRERPQFYNTLTTNCTTMIWFHAKVSPDRVPLSWKVLASGHVPEFLFEHGRLAVAGNDFQEVRRRASINARAHAAGTAGDFSRRIRQAEGGS